MEEVTQQIEQFFAAYEERFNRSLNGKVDTKGTVRSFDERFIEASLVGILAGKNNKTFKKAIKQGYERYKSIGTKSMQIVKQDITPLNDFVVMNRVSWVSHYQKKDSTSVTIPFEVIYLLHKVDGEYKIFTYITGNEEEVLRQNGVIK